MKVLLNEWHKMKFVSVKENLNWSDTIQEPRGFFQDYGDWQADSWGDCEKSSDKSQEVNPDGILYMDKKCSCTGWLSGFW